MKSQSNSPEKMTANRREPEENRGEVEECEKKNENGEIAVGAGIDQALKTGVLRGRRAHPPKHDSAGEQSAKDGADTEPKELRRAGGFGDAKCDAGKHTDVHDLIADEVDPFADGCFLENDARDITIDTIDNGRELQEESSNDGGLVSAKRKENS